jgi:putative transposase
VITTMTARPNPIDFPAVVEQLQQAQPDLLRSMLTAFVQALMSADADAVCGAEFGTRSPERTNRRNGYRSREWDTRAGTIELAIPKVRSERHHMRPALPRRVTEPRT